MFRVDHRARFFNTSLKRQRRRATPFAGASGLCRTITHGHIAWCLPLILVVHGTAVGDERESPVSAAPTVITQHTETGRQSKIRVLLPSPDARLWFEDLLMRSPGTERSFRSPALQPGKRYTYRVTASWRENGQVINHETHIAFSAGEDVLIDFRRPGG